MNERSWLILTSAERVIVKWSKLLLISWAVIPGLALVSRLAVADASCPRVGFTIVEPLASPATRSIKVGKNQTIFVRRVPITTTSDIVAIKLVRELHGESADAADLLIRFTPAAEKRLSDATTNHSGRRIAFMFNDEALINIVWEGQYGMDPGGSRVSMNHGLNALRKLMKAIRRCTGATTSRTP